MKIGIVTHYYKSTNYGGNLQAYALCKYLSKEHQVEQICYCATKNTVPVLTRLKKEGLFTFIKKGTGLAVRKISGFFNRLKNQKIREDLNKRSKAIATFNESIPHSSVCYTDTTIQEAENQYDFFITGSDQVWHPQAVNQAYLLAFVSSKPKISYAASLAVTELSNEQKERMRQSLKGYSAISVREQSGVELIQPLVDQQVEVVVDPVFLLEKEEWDIIAKEKIIERPYLFCYFLGENKQARKLAEKFAKEKGLALITLPFLLGQYRSVDKNFGDIKLYDVSPAQFLSLIKYAEYVFTDSFHALAFSHIFEKQYFVFNRDKKGGMNSRIFDMLELIDAKERFCLDTAKLDLKYLNNLERIQYASKNQKCEALKEKSKNFLTRNISQEQKYEKSLNKQPTLPYIICNGCQACQNICSKNCITMQANAEGFYYPKIDKNRCINCKLCERICPVLNGGLQKDNEISITAYATINKDEKMRLESSSGGVFTAIATEIIRNGGVVFGAAFKEDFSVVHKYVETIEDLNAFRGSKYVQSAIGDTYKQAEGFLKTGRLVLFTGTPCQIGGLYSFLRRPYDNLITQDIICHGVPSPMVWQKYIEHKAGKNDGAKLSGINFRAKDNGWKNYSIAFQFDNGAEDKQLASKDTYIKAFLSDLCLRPSCYNCAFKNKHRESDITLADFWGIQNVLPEMDDDKGTSLVLIHSEKGLKIFENIKANFIYKETNIDKALLYNSAMISSAKEPKNRDAFMDEIKDGNFDSVAKKYLKIPLHKKCRKILSNIKHKVFKK